MKILNKNDLKKHLGGIQRHTCEDQGDGTTRCTYVNTNTGVYCEGHYTYSGATIELNCHNY